MPAQVHSHLPAVGLTKTDCCCVALDFSIHYSQSLRGQPPSTPESLWMVEVRYVFRLRNFALYGVALCSHSSPVKDRCWLICSAFCLRPQSALTTVLGWKSFRPLWPRDQLPHSSFLFCQSSGVRSGQNEAQVLQKAPCPWD